jgi:hypothetical protein
MYRFINVEYPKNLENFFGSLENFALSFIKLNKTLGESKLLSYDTGKRLEN